ncbi:MAG TPA: HEAT repeat domain-containing protein [Longimicrobiales bacterium]
MMRTVLALVGVAVFSGHGAPAAQVEAPRASLRTPASTVAVADASAFLAAARGADPVLCALAAAPVGNGWGDTGAPRSDAEAGAALVAWALKPTVSERDLIVLEEGLRGADDCVRTMAARLLADAGARVLLDALGDANATTRRAAAEGLGFAEAPRAVPALSDRLADDDVATVRAAAAWALGRIEDPSAEAALGRALRDDDALVRRAAVHALGRLELETSIELLLPMLNDRDAGIRAATARALGELH